MDNPPTNPPTVFVIDLESLCGESRLSGGREEDVAPTADVTGALSELICAPGASRTAWDESPEQNRQRERTGAAPFWMPGRACH